MLQSNESMDPTIDSNSTKSTEASWRNEGTRRNKEAIKSSNINNDSSLRQPPAVGASLPVGGGSKKRSLQCTDMAGVEGTQFKTLECNLRCNRLAEREAEVGGPNMSSLGSCSPIRRPQSSVVLLTRAKRQAQASSTNLGDRKGHFVEGEFKFTGRRRADHEERRKDVEREAPETVAHNNRSPETEVAYSYNRRADAYNGHLSVRWPEQESPPLPATVSWAPALFVMAAEPEVVSEQREPPSDPSADQWLPSGAEPEMSRQQLDLIRGQKNRVDRLLTEDMLMYRDGAGGQQLSLGQEQRASPLDHVKHHRKHHHHQQAHKHHKHARSNNPHDHEAQTSQRVRRNHDGGFYDGTAADRPVVASRKGLVRGVTQKLFTGKFVDAFLGMPYAKPPVGNYRFRHPQPIDPWQGELEASRLPNSCYQVNDTFFGANFQGTKVWNANTPLSEDCLYLNIWTPFGVANTTVSSTPNKVYRPPRPLGAGGEQGSKTSSRRPVLVWIFGGGFYYGTSTLAVYEGGLLASEEDIIVVSINYRVSALGFLYLGRPDAPGNAGLFDQLLALQWIQDNIDQFGGDPSRVTIFGESAGAVSAAFHLLSPLSRNLFSQAILQSGAATCPWGCMEPREIMTNGLKLASLLNCPTNASDLDSVVDCLIRVDPMSMVQIAQDVDPNRSLLNFPFVPVVDGSFLLESPNESLVKSNFKRAPILLGSNYDEGSAFLIYLTEFNHCPGGSGSAGSQPTDLDAPLTGNSKPPLAQANPNGNNKLPPPAAGYPTTISEPAAMGELRDQSLDSVELLAPAGQQQQSAAALLASPNEASSEVGGGSPGAGRTSQHSLPPNFSDSNPCKPNETPSLTREGFLRTLNDYLNPYAEHPIGKEAIVFEYSNWNNPQDSISNYDALDKIVGDYHFTCHVNEFAHRYASTGNPVYYYYFKQRSSVSQWPKWMGVLHGDEIAFVFGEPLNQLLNYTAREVELSRRIMKYWANFAKFGNPTKLGENVSMAEKWPEYGNNRQYFELHGDLIRIGRGPRAKQCAFWAHYLPKLIDSFDHSQCPASSGSAAASSLNDQYRCLPTRYHPLDPRFSANQRAGLLNNFPSVVIVSLSVILVLSIIARLCERLSRCGDSINRLSILIERRWRNQRAAASMNQQQQQQQPTATTTQPAATTANTAPQLLTGGSGAPNLMPESGSVGANSSLSAAGRQQQQLSGGMQLHNLRPTSGPQFPANSGGLAKSPMGAGLIGGEQQQQTSAEQQSALDLAQSAAARVTGSAAAAIAAARFKMLRSNTLAAAFGLPASAEPTPDGPAPVDMLAMRTKDERVVNTLSFNAGGRNKLN